MSIAQRVPSNHSPLKMPVPSNRSPSRRNGHGETGTGYFLERSSRIPSFHRTCYGPWRQVSAVNARSYFSQCRALMLKAVTHNILILYAPSEPLTQAA